MYRCTYCEYSTPYLHNLKRHEKNKHYKAPISTTQPTIDYSSAAENRQHLTGYQVPQQGLQMNGSGVLHTTQQYDPRTRPQIQYNELNHQGYGPQHPSVYQNGSGVLRTTQEYDPRAKPQIQNNEVKPKGKGPQTSVSYSVSQKPETNEDTDNETDTETVSEADTEDLEEHDVYEILNDIHLAFNHLKELREQYRKALPQLKELDEEEMDLFLYKYAELKIDVIDEQDGLEGRKTQTGSGIDEEYEGDTDEEAIDEDDDENIEGDTDEEPVDEDADDEEAVEDMDDEASGKVKENCNGCLKERFFDFIFEAEEFISSDFHQKMLHYEKIFRDDITEAIENLN